MKEIIVTFSNGETWSIPAGLVAQNAAEYWSSKDGGSSYEDEYNAIINDSHELIDWLTGNMNWADVVNQATLLEAGNFDYSWNDMLDYGVK